MREGCRNPGRCNDRLCRFFLPFNYDIMQPINQLPFEPHWSFFRCIKEQFVFFTLLSLLLISFCSCNSQNDPMDPPDPPDPPIENKLFECTDSILSNCPLVGQWTFINSGCVPVNENDWFAPGGVVDHRNSIVFTSDGKMFFTYLTNSELWGNWSDLIRYYDVVDCKFINVRSQENEIIDQIEIIELTENRLRLRNDAWCGTEDCLFIRTSKPYNDDENNNALNEEICKLHKCQTCGNNNSGYECSISYKYVDIIGALNYVSSEKYEDRIIVCTEKHLLCLNLNFEILWKDSIDFDLKEPYYTSFANNFTVDDKGNTYIFYYTEHPQPNISYDIPHMRKYDINGNLIFQRDYNFNDFKRDKGFVLVNTGHVIKHYNSSIYFVHSGLFGKFDLDGNILTLKETNEFNRKNIYPTNNYIYIGFGDQTTFPKETIDFDLNNISPVNYQYSSILRTDDFAVLNNNVFLLGNKLLITGQYTRQAEHTVWGYHVPGIIVQSNEITDIVRSFNLHLGCPWGVVPITDTSIVSVCDDYFELITQDNGKFRSAFRYKNEINSSDYYDDFKFHTAYQINNKIILLGTGKRFTETILGVIVDLDKLYPDISCK